MSRLRRLACERPVAAVLSVTAFALALRLVTLGDRTLHWDEARVAYWTLRYVRDAGFVYRPTIHGPFVPLVVAPLFERLGPTAFAARLPVAVLGGSLPLAALLYRRPDEEAVGLSNTETVALAVLLAVLPGFVYYARFMRSDVPLAVFVFVAVGFGVRALATARRRDVVVAGLALGFALTTKENVLLYLACFVGTGAVALCWPAVATRLGVVKGDYRARLRVSLARGRTHLRHHLPAVPFAVLAALLPVVFFYAPRAPAGDPSLGGALAGDVSWIALVARATIGTWETFAASVWASGHPGSYPFYFAKILGFVLVGALPAVVGAGAAIREELAGRHRRLVVPFVAWGIASMFGYPHATDIPAPWTALHIVLPLLVPAAIGWVSLADRGWFERERWARLRGSRRSLVAALLVLSAVSVPLVVGLGFVTPPPQANVLAQSAQPADDLDPLVATIDAVADDATERNSAGSRTQSGDDSDDGVLYYGDEYFLPNESLPDTPPAQDADWVGSWLNRLPMDWYVERARVPSEYASDVDALQERESLPPVVFAAAPEADEITGELSERGYNWTRYDLGLYHEQAVVVFVDESRLDEK